jgi:hypothetical protein
VRPGDPTPRFRCGLPPTRLEPMVAELILSTPIYCRSPEVAATAAIRPDAAAVFSPPPTASRQPLASGADAGRQRFTVVVYYLPVLIRTAWRPTYSVRLVVSGCKRDVRPLGGLRKEDIIKLSRRRRRGADETRRSSVVIRRDTRRCSRRPNRAV